MTTYAQRKEVLQHLTAYGYIREHLCYQLYLKVFDEWDIDKSNDNLDIDVESGIIETKYKNSIWGNAFGSVCVKKGDIETWKIKLLSEIPAIKKVGIVVGIVEHSKASNKMRWAFCVASNRAGIGYYGKRQNKIFDGLNGLGSDGRGISYWHYPQNITLTLDMSHMTQTEKDNEQFGRLLMTKGK